ncbi:MAG: hypothetical protein ACI9A1_001765 [Lentimonas sp.]|jgi:hypothetical protein
MDSNSTAGSDRYFTEGVNRKSCHGMIVSIDRLFLRGSFAAVCD